MFVRFQGRRSPACEVFSLLCGNGGKQNAAILFRKHYSMIVYLWPGISPNHAGSVAVIQWRCVRNSDNVERESTNQSGRLSQGCCFSGSR
jgi:hypothetical protein